MRNSIAKVILVVLLLSLVLGSLQCSAGENITKMYAASDQKAASVDSDLVASNTKFAFDIFRVLIKDNEDEDKNIFISPLSISTALTMTYNGAQGATKEAMGNTLQFLDMPLEEVNQGYSDLIYSLEGVDEEIKLQIANSIWMAKGFDSSVKPDFKQRISEYFDGEVFARDFGNQQTADEINSWVSKETEGKIDDLVQSLSPETVMLLINAIYFKGAWTYEFDESLTKKEDFFLSDGNVVSADVMSKTAPFGYYEGDNFEAVKLPYGRDKIAMYVFLPGQEVSLDSFINELDQQSFDEYMSGFDSDELTVKLPKFKIEYGKRLNDTLKTLGMVVAFSGGADFSAMASVPLWIDHVDHKAIIEVNEKGSEAAAATVVAMLGSVPPTFSVDRPFFFVIRDDRSGSILFMGKVIDPTRN